MYSNALNLNTLQEDQTILKNATLSKYSYFIFIVVVYEKFFYYFEKSERN